jgi:acetyl esterase/lipase
MPPRSYFQTYGSHPEQVADLYLPDADASGLPVVVLIHGGFWRERFRRDLMEPLAADLCERGVAAWNIEYRRLDCGGGWPETGEDVAAAIDALADLDAPLDLDDVMLVGHSAGGHLALWAAGRAGARVVPRGVVAAAAVTDVQEAIRCDLGAGVVARFAEGADWDEISPICRVPTGVDTLLQHGTEDDTVPPEFSERYAAAAGDEVTLSLREGEGHFEALDPESAAWQEIAEWLTA